MQILLLLSLYSWLCYCKSFSSNAIEVRKVYTNVVYNFRDGLSLDVIIIIKNLYYRLCDLSSTEVVKACVKIYIH